MKYTAVRFDGVTSMGCFIKNAQVLVPKDYTMTCLVKTLREEGYVSFMTNDMKILVHI